ncbi:MAG: Gfo/Idh/MocA family oxidoreductase [Acidobacteriota bacterium]|nr:Gfo/Idh/MocA family oxidoreductase [Acidobacteriota bacterium]
MVRNGISRRDFIRSSAGAGITLAAPSIILEQAELYASPAPASGAVRFGMIGIGMEGSGVLSTCIRIPGAECVAACDLYDERHTLANQIISGVTGKTVTVTRRYQDLLENKDIDCIVVAVPDHWHSKIIVDGCNAGKDVYCEKPMTHKVEEGFEIIDAARKNNRIVQIGSQRRSSIGIAKAKELVEQGAIGDVYYAEGILGRNSPCGAWVYPPPPGLSPENLDWETWLGDAPKRPFDPIRFARWRAYKDYGEGIPGDLYVHSLTGIHTVMGVVAPPQRAQSTGGLFQWKDGRDYPDLHTTFYDYPNFRVAILMTLNSDEPEVTRFLGTRGIIEVDGEGERVTVAPQDGKDHEPCYYTSSYPAKMRAAYDKAWREKNDPVLGESKMVEGENYVYPPGYSELREHLWHFFQSVQTRQPSVEDAVFGNGTAIGCHMANYSYFNKTAAIWDENAKKITSA